MVRTALGLYHAKHVRESAERKFFSSIRMKNGTVKKTFSHRLDNINAAVNEKLVELGMWPREVLDVGASSGISSFEWLNDLRAAGFKPRVMATDLTMTAYLISLAWGVGVLVDREGVPLQYSVLGTALRPWHRRRDYYTGYSILRPLLARWMERLGEARGARELLASVRAGSDPKEISRIRELKLISPRVAADPDLEFHDDDILKVAPSFEGRFDIVRAANILIPDYFTDEDIRLALRNLLGRMTGPGALLVVAQNDNADDSNHATLFRVTEGRRFEPLLRIGRGSRIEPLICSFTG
jgi:hypothetical protein